MRFSSPFAVFVGTTPNIGTTTAAFAAALRLAEASGKQIGYLCLHLKSAKLHRFVGVDEPEMSLDKLQPELRSGSLTADMLRRAMYALPGQPNLRMLFGSMNREQAEFFGAQDIEHLLNAAESAYSYIVLDVGAYWDNAATICAVRRASSRIVVTTPALSHFQEDGRRWIGQMSSLFDVQTSQYDCVVVRAPWSGAGYRMKEICNELGVSPLGQFHLDESLLGSLDRGAYDDWLMSEGKGKSAMRETALTLMERHGLRGAFAPMAQQPWYRKLLNRRNEVNSI